MSFPLTPFDEPRSPPAIEPMDVDQIDMRRALIAALILLPILLAVLACSLALEPSHGPTSDASPKHPPSSAATVEVGSSGTGVKR